MLPLNSVRIDLLTIERALGNISNLKVIETLPIHGLVHPHSFMYTEGGPYTTHSQLTPPHYPSTTSTSVLSSQITESQILKKVFSSSPPALAHCWKSSSSSAQPSGQAHDPFQLMNSSDFAPLTSPHTNIITKVNPHAQSSSQLHARASRNCSCRREGNKQTGLHSITPHV